MLQRLEERLRELLDAVAAGPDGKGAARGTAAWTGALKQGVGTLGHEWGYSVAAAGLEGADAHHWLFDVVLSRNGGEEPGDVLLVMESEWSHDRDDITWDYAQLLLVKAALKLFVYQQANRNLLAELTAALERLTRSFRVTTPGERYLLAGYCCSDRCFEYTTIIV